MCKFYQFIYNIYKYLIFIKNVCVVFCDRDFEIATSLLYGLTQPSLSLSYSTPNLCI